MNSETTTNQNQTDYKNHKGDHQMNCKECKTEACEMNGMDFEISQEKCEAIDKLTKGQVPDGYVEIGGEQ